MIIGTLGTLDFEVSSKVVATLDGLSISSKARIAKHDILGSKPKLEYQGLDLMDVSFNIYLNLSLGVSVNKKLREINDLFGMRLDLAIGSKYYGEFLLLGVDQNVKYHTKNGNIHAVEVAIQLQEYISDNN
jgi:hypothetical protein